LWYASFRPVQTAIGGEFPGVGYTEYAPSPTLADCIYGYWWLRGAAESDRLYRHQVIADACLDVFFERCNPNRAFIIGVSERYIEFELEADFDFFGIRLLPTALPRLFGVPAGELRNQVVDLADVCPGFAKSLTENIQPEMEGEECPGKLDGILNDIRRRPLTETDPRLLNALTTMVDQQGNLSLSQDLNDVGISQRQLRRLFLHDVGVSPKTFCRVLRFQAAYQELQRSTVASINGSYFDLGYFDQAHFIKEFRQYAGKPPGGKG